MAALAYDPDGDAHCYMGIGDEDIDFMEDDEEDDEEDEDLWRPEDEDDD